MRDPMNWAVTLYRAFDIRVRVHLLFFVFTLGMFIRGVSQDNSVVSPLDVFLFTVVLLFGTVLLHEYGHCIGARAVGGIADDILIWPLGGLAFVSPPHNWKANFITTAAGPFVDVVICVVCGLMLIGAGYYPNANPISNPYICELKNYHEGRTYTSEYALSLYPTGSSERAVYRIGKPDDLNTYAEKYDYERALAPTWVVWIQRTFWLNWVLILFNLIPAFPLDGGRMLMALIWRKSDYARAMTIAAFSGYICGMIFLVVSIASNEALFVGFSMFMIISSYLALKQLEGESGAFGYDFSAGYTSLNSGEEEEPRRRKQAGFLRRWLNARTAKRLRREVEERERDDQRMDELLEKIARQGKQSLTDDDRRFMERVSARYRNQ